MNERYRAGIIGLGFIGAGDQVSGDRIGQQVVSLDGNHREALQGNPRLALVTGSSRDPGRRERFAERTGATTYADYRQMLDREKLDVVSVASYATSHAELVVACAERGVRAIYCEKPLATTLSDAERMIDACRQSGSLLVVNHNRRFHPLYREVARRLRGGLLGELTGMWLQWSAGRLGNVGTHFLDVALMWTGGRFASVSATLDLAGKPDCRGPEFRDPGGWGMIRMHGGPIVHVHAPDYAAAPAELTVHGMKGRVVVGRSGACFESWNGEREAIVPAAPPTGSSMDVAVQEIVRWLDDGTPVCCDAEDSRHTLETILGCHASHARNGAWVDLPLTGADRDREVLSG